MAIVLFYVNRYWYLTYYIFILNTGDLYGKVRPVTVQTVVVSNNVATLRRGMLFPQCIRRYLMYTVW